MKKVVIAVSNISNINPEAKSRLESAGFSVEEYADTLLLSQKELISLLHQADAVIAGLESYPEEVLTSLPSLKLIARRGVGVDNIDMEAAKSLGITVTRTAGLVGIAVAELVMGYLLEHSRMLSLHNTEMKNNTWNRHLAEGVNGKTLGLVGFGSIAREVAVRANAFGMKVVCYYRHRDTAIEKEYAVQYIDFKTLINTSDYISINVPLTNETTGMFHREIFQKMKNTAVIINTARSKIINTVDLVNALQNQEIGGAYIDVFDNEPYHDGELMSCDNAFLTPHIGTFTKSTFQAMNSRCIDQVIEFFNVQGK